MIIETISWRDWGPWKDSFIHDIMIMSAGHVWKHFMSCHSIIQSWQSWSQQQSPEETVSPLCSLSYCGSQPLLAFWMCISRMWRLRALTEDCPSAAPLSFSQTLVVLLTNKEHFELANKREEQCFFRFLEKVWYLDKTKLTTYKMNWTTKTWTMIN